jgi:phosphoribosyl-ATP pyrophosphohydrolase/phosphoribosyl-AMP cyclohydrolase
MDGEAMTLSRPEWIDRVKYDANGLVACIAQCHATGDVLMLAWMNANALEQTLATGAMWYWSRSRGELWEKGATSGATQRAVSLHLDCDGDAILAIVEQSGGGACHTGAATCWSNDAVLDGHEPRHIVSALRRIIEQRDAERPEGSYTTRLLIGGVDRIGKKVGEEATEVVIAAKNAANGKGTEELANESADLIYHLLVLWQSVGLSPLEVVRALEKRR